MRIVYAYNGSGRSSDGIVNQFPVILWNGDDSVIVLVQRQVKWLLISVDVGQSHRAECPGVNHQVEIPRRGDMSHSCFQYTFRKEKNNENLILLLNKRNFTYFQFPPLNDCHCGAIFK